MRNSYLSPHSFPPKPFQSIEKLADQYNYVNQYLDFSGLYTPINRAYYLKFIKYGNYIDITIYNRIRLSYKNPSRSFVRSHKNKRTDKSLKRTADQIYRLVIANAEHYTKYATIFATFKYHRNEKSLHVAYTDFSLFIKRLKYHMDFPIRYVAVPEFQKRGAIHFHVVFFDVPFVPVSQIEQLWGHGSHNQGVDWQCAKHLQATGSYLIKYIQKSVNDSRFNGYRIVLSSRNLIRPFTSFDAGQLENILYNKSVNTLKVFQNNNCKIKTIKI